MIRKVSAAGTKVSPLRGAADQVDEGIGEMGEVAEGLVGDGRFLPGWYRRSRWVT